MLSVSAGVSPLPGYINYASKDASETLYLCQCSLLVLKSGADAHGREASTPSIMSSK